MKPITFPAAGRLAGLAVMLEIMGHDTSDQQIALCMEAPYLLVNHNGEFRAGSRLYYPQWMNLYLLPRGFRMVERCLPRSEALSVLRACAPAMLTLERDKNIPHPVIFTGYVNQRYEFANIKPPISSELDNFSFSSAMLRRRLPEEVTLWTLEQCASQPVDFIPLLLESLRALDAYLDVLLNLHTRTVSREELKSLHTPFFRALMIDLYPMALLMNDADLAEELRLLHHDYHHIFTINGPDHVELSDRLPKSAIRRCIAWYRENIIDRLYSLGADEEMLEELAYHKH